MQKRLKFALSLWFVAVWLLCANPAAADSIDGNVAPNSETLDDKWDDLPDADLSGWFLNFDPSQQWTNAENVATMKHWLSLVLHLGEDSSLSTQLSELGAPGSGTSGTGTSVLGTTGGETSAGTQLTLNTSTL